MQGDALEGAGLAALGVVSAAVVGVLTARAVPGGPLLERRRTRGIRLPRRASTLSTRAAQRLNHSSALLSLAVFADSSIEHYRGMFNNRAMVLPLLASAATLASSLHGAHDETATGHRVRHAIAAIAGLIGVAGGGFHLYNVTKREGGFSWNNLFYGAPLGCAVRADPGRCHGHRRRTYSRQHGGPTAAVPIARGTDIGSSDQWGPDRHGRRSGTAAFPRRLS